MYSHLCKCSHFCYPSIKYLERHNPLSFFSYFFLIEPFLTAFCMKGVRVMIHWMKESSRTFPFYWIISTVDIKLLSRQTGIIWVWPGRGGTRALIRQYKRMIRTNKDLWGLNTWLGNVARNHPCTYKATFTACLVFTASQLLLVHLQPLGRALLFFFLL